jgi:proline dehydrogenase
MEIFNKFVVYTLPFVPKFIVYLFAKKYIAGSRLQDAIDLIKRFNNKHILATVDILGEDVSDKDDALKVVTEYKEVLAAIDKNNLDSNISLKPTHLGLKIDKEFCCQNIREIVKTAKSYNNFVRIDMEDHTCTSDSIEIYIKLKKEFDNVGLVVQSYLRRTVHDVNTLIQHKANLRLCKGIYVEPKHIAYKDPDIINYNFNYCLEKLLSAKCYVGIATHDEKLIWYALSLIDKLHLKKEDYEFQMLLGVTEELRDLLLSAGHCVRVYVPYGQHWYAYSTRRLKENPRIASYVIKHILNKG